MPPFPGWPVIFQCVHTTSMLLGWSDLLLFKIFCRLLVQHVPRKIDLVVAKESFICLLSHLITKATKVGVLLCLVFFM